MSINFLLQQVKEISRKYDLINKRTGGYFNIFEIANIADNEVAICRVICELLSPTGSHYQGSTYLKLFMENVLGLEVLEEELLTAKVNREVLTQNNRRIDIVIQTNKRFIPIEVKIYASDQKNQCLDYYKEAKNSDMYYLTRFGASPSEYSCGQAESEHEEIDGITNISFSNDILNWLDECLKQKETIKITSIREIILQLSAIIHKFTNQMEDEKEMEIKKIIMSSSENMRTSIEIEKNLKLSKTCMIEKIFKNIENRIDKNIQDQVHSNRSIQSRRKLENEYDYRANNKEKVKNYYNNKKSTYPGISYLYKSNIKPNIDIWIRIEIDHRIFIGYYMANNGNWDKQTFSKNEIKEYININKPKVNNWWSYWQYLPDNQKITTPNFKDFNEAYIDLFDDENFDIFIDKCVEKIDELFER